MCLSSVWSKKKTKEWLKDKPEKIRVWRIMRVLNGEYYPLFHQTATPFRPGLNNATAPVGDGNYRLGYHSFYQKTHAEAWRYRTQARVQCFVPKKSVLHIGTQLSVLTGQMEPIIVSTEVICPKYVGNIG